MRCIDMREPIKDFYNRIIGYIDTKPNGDQTGYDFYKRIVSKGDTLVGLLYAEQEKEQQNVKKTIFFHLKN